MDFIIKKPTSSNRTVRMPDTLIEKITELAARMDVSFNQVVVQCCEYAIENLPKSSEKKTPSASKSEGVFTALRARILLAGGANLPGVRRQN